MKPVENVSIGGYVFTVEDDARAVAESYISELDSFYLKEPGGAEVMEGIEERMSELLLEQCGSGGVVTLGMVESVIATLGKPEAIEEESTGSGDQQAPAGEERKAAKDDYKVKRKLYRDPANGKVAGVCAGLGAYFGIDPTIFRIIFTIFTLVGGGVFIHRGSAVFPDYAFPIIYAILWICMPVARTIRQRDELRGEKGTVDAISARVMEAANEVGDVAGNIAKSDAWSGLWRILGICLGMIFLVAGVAGVVSIGYLTVGDNFLSNTFVVNRAIEQIASDAPALMEMLSSVPFVIALAVSIVIPFIALIYLGMMLIFDLKAPKWHPGICLFVIWLVAVTVLAVIGLMIVFQGSI